jgi:hypothetical protein
MNTAGWDFGGRVRVQDEENSRIAAGSVEGIAPTQREIVWRLVRERGPMATWEIEEALQGLHQSISATVNHLHRMGALVNTGTKNRTPSGRPSWIYRAVTQEEADRAMGVTRPDPLPPGKTVSPLRGSPPAQCSCGEGPVGHSTSHTSTERPGIVRISREGKTDQYMNIRATRAASVAAQERQRQEEADRVKKDTPRVDPRSHRLTFGGPVLCRRCGGTGGSLWEACFGCGGTGLT